MSSFKLEKLKLIRVAVSILFFVPICLLFLDPRNSIPESINVSLVSLQFIPSLLKIFFYVSITTIGLAVVIVLTFAFGRIYCSTLCPLGTFQDFIIRFSKKINRRKHFKYVKPPFIFHYLLLIITTILTVAGSMTLLNLFEPFSSFGRIVTNLFEPLMTLANNVLAEIFGKFQIFFFYNIPVRKIDLSVMIVPATFLGVIVYLSYKHGRLFCNSLCPAGALLGLMSRISLYKIVINENTCNDCGACEKVCKANCIESASKLVDFSACVGCFNCIKSCPQSSVTYARYRLAASPEKYNPLRRQFIKEISTPAIGLAVPAFASSNTTAASTSGYIENKKYPVTPPGSRSVNHFSSLCTACHSCVSVCPTQVLYPSLFDYGISGIFQPRMNYTVSYCNYECTLCSQICPSGAILPVEAEAKKIIQIGKTVFVKDDCVVVARKKACSACSEHCPTKAVYMVQYEEKLKIPELNNDICIGCGACEFACPTTPRKAIYVKANQIHLQAQKPKVKKQEEIFDSSKEFPF
ncbi:MAG: 4Fe-4S binding protein [Bacteroidota bacterium]|nr:4Fe-4S binding protein [Bacteroidota bacterium]